MTKKPPVRQNAVLDVLKQYWGYDSLRPLQAEAIAAGIDHRDSLVVMPTGGGKSICYQIPPMVADRTDVVVSPLISLMKDQVDGLRECGYPAACLHSGMTDRDRREALDDAMNGRIRLLFVAPERLMIDGFLRSLEQIQVRSFAIDEAHCISHWGHDFRPEYRRLAELKRRFPVASFHAYTATATERVRADIIKQLGLRDPAVLVGNFDRPNLTYRVIPRDDVYGQAVEVIQRHAGEAVIIYCISRKDTEEMCSHLRAKKIKAVFYHAGMSPDARRKSQEAFANEEIDVVVATVAFGMGIDRSNVRCVIHAAMPKSIEHYQQETGRAGRDGLDAECVLLYSPSDIAKWKYILTKGAEEGGEGGMANLQPQFELLGHLQSYCQPYDCRHKRLVEYFGQRFEKTSCDACDVCLNESGDMVDATVLAQKILSCVARTKEKFGAKHIADVLRGGDTEMIRKWNHQTVSTYGIIKDMTVRDLTIATNQLADLGLLDRSNDGYATLKLNDASWAVMRGRQNVRLPKAPVAVTTEDRSREISWVGVDRGLFEELRLLRKEFADERGIAPFMVFGDASLRDMARRRPRGERSFRSMQGVGEAKMQEFSARFIACIDQYCAKQGLAEDMSAGPPQSASAPRREGKSPSGPVLRAYELFASGASVETVAEELHRAPGTVEGYLSDFIEREKPSTIGAWVSDADYCKIKAISAELGTARLKPIFEALNGSVPYPIIRLTTAHMNAVSNGR
ncbi:MAG: DNA helicase RecQ [Planctomycetes bacterium]|nr:DNA helicase RecQ [Planctomycetota bacterium]